MDLSKLSDTNRNNLLRFWDWMRQSGRAKIFRFNVAGADLFRLLSYDAEGSLSRGMHKTTSDMIDDFLSVDAEQLDFFVNNSTISDWNSDNPEMYACYRILKTLWLSEDVAKNGVQAPMQLIQYGRNYQTHPGSDKKLVITHINPCPNIPMFYIWYPEMDSAPWVWTVQHTEVRTPEEFCDMFVNAEHPSFQIKYSEINFNHDGWINHEPHLDPWAVGVHATLRKYGKLNPDLNLTLPTVSYTDSVHRLGGHQEIKRLMALVKRTGEDVFWLGDNRKFIRYNGVWILDRFLNFPVSLVDQDWCWDQDRAIYYDNLRPNISRYRTDM